MANVFAIQGVIILLVILIYRLCFRKSAGLPPGPRRLPLVGNIRDFPPGGVFDYSFWLKHKEIYGPVSSITVMGRPIIIIHDRQAAHDLLGKKSANSLALPRLDFASKLCGFDRFPFFQDASDTLLRRRKLIHQQMGSRAAAARFEDIQEVEVKRFILRVLDDPGDIINHIKT